MKRRRRTVLYFAIMLSSAFVTIAIGLYGYLRGEHLAGLITCLTGTVILLAANWIWRSQWP